MIPRVKITHDGSKNATVQVTCYGAFDWTRLISVEDFNPPPKHFKIDALHYAASEGVEVQLAWASGDERHPMLPIAGRGKLDLEGVGGLHATTPEDGVGIDMRTVTWDSRQLDESYIITLVFDLSKHSGVR